MAIIDKKKKRKVLDLRLQLRLKLQIFNLGLLQLKAVFLSIQGKKRKLEEAENLNALTKQRQKIQNRNSH